MLQLVMLQPLTSTQFIPHGHCYLWQPGLVGIHLISDLLIALAYFSIPLTLVYFVRKRQDVPFNWVFLLFGAFIVCCGTTHLLSIWTLWHPTYWLSGLVKAITAAVSLYTAIQLFPLMPKVLSLPSPAQLEAEIEERKQVEAKLRFQTLELEQTLKELRQTQTQLIQQEKMSSLGQLVSGVAHEINNPVNFVQGNLDHAQQYVNDLLEVIATYETAVSPPPPPVVAKVEEVDLAFLKTDLPKLMNSMKLGAERIQGIVKALRNFSRLDESAVKAVNLHDGIDSTLLILQHRLKAKPDFPAIEVVKDYGDLPLVECLAGQLNQVFMNLISNAIDALEDCDCKGNEVRPTLTICTRHQATANTVVIEVSDNGPGIPETLQPRLFDSGFTTKAVGKGTGLGLSISQEVVKDRHRGSLSCESAVGKGTRFRIELPQRHPTETKPEPVLPPHCVLSLA
jgi:two-component system NtrC family sensor kinase